MPEQRTLDLRDVPPAHVRGELLARLRELAAGDSLCVRFNEDPDLALRSADLHLGERLSWQVARATDRSWVATLRLDDAGSAADVLTLLRIDHRRLDALLARALTGLNAGDARTGAAAFSDCARALKRHIDFEDRVLLPMLDCAAIDATLQLMRSEHAEIENQMKAIEESLAASDGGMSEAAILCGMLAGVMAKHEHREESLVFPRWRAAIAMRAAHDQEALLRSARASLELAAD